MRNINFESSLGLIDSCASLAAANYQICCVACGVSSCVCMCVCMCVCAHMCTCVCKGGCEPWLPIIAYGRELHFPSLDAPQTSWQNRLKSIKLFLYTFFVACHRLLIRARQRMTVSEKVIALLCLSSRNLCLNFGHDLGGTIAAKYRFKLLNVSNINWRGEDWCFSLDLVVPSIWWFDGGCGHRRYDRKVYAPYCETSGIQNLAAYRS